MAERKPVYIRCPRCELNYCLKKDKFCSVCKAEMEGDKDAFVNELDLELCPICKTNYIQPEEIMCASCLKERQAQGKDLDDDDEWNAYITRDDDDDYVSDDEETGDMASISDLDNDVLSDDLVDDLDFGFESMLDDEDFDDEEEEEEEEESAEDDFEDIDEDGIDFDAEDEEDGEPFKFDEDEEY